jgi:hypothetical protein
MLTHNDLINVAMRKAGFSSRINPPSQDMIEDAFTDLKLLIPELSSQLPIVAAQFNQYGDITEPCGLEDGWINAIAYELAKRIQPDYASVLGPDFLTSAMDSMTNLKLALLEVPSLERRSDMPVGAGWKQPVDLNYYKAKGCK